MAQLPNEQNATNVQPQIDLNDDIDMPEVQPVQPPAPNVVQNGNQTNDEQPQQQHQQQQQQHSIDVVQQDPLAVVSVHVPADRLNQNQQTESASINGMQPPASTRPRARARARSALNSAIRRLGRNRSRSKPRKAAVS